MRKMSMSRFASPPICPASEPSALVARAAEVLGCGLATLPFGPGDTTVGTEAELQTVVEGSRQAVDLPLWIEGSRYFANVCKRARSGDSPRRLATEIERFLEGNREGVWDNSWVRSPRWVLRPAAQAVLERDLRADRSDAFSPPRSDRERFEFTGPDGEPWLRVPVSYLLKLALADAIDPAGGLPPLARERGRACLERRRWSSLARS